MNDKISPRLVGAVLVLIFITLNVWGYYLYQKGIFGAGADVIPSASPTSALENSDAVYMIPGI
ncbi:MAG: hypothetical protein CEN92_472 [Candidatus Berkelbacteria bacterium Licking1014_96]|uniref:Uncharacterized protein n=1 Tax=Candidatus Berkelbacteria bacterium Licking1014_96 TaxID=2017149 RepID=A0A554LBQ2_9BACT|nr:MAG: hypothetical protein CEN92_472 [Candidatus Berkelbacteria bacterium Licking1014_96]